MMTIFIAPDKEKIKELLSEMLSKIGNSNINITKEGDTIKISDKQSLKELVSLKEKIIELEDSLYNEKRGVLYKSVLEVIEKPMIEHVLERTEGNQLKAARVLGLNRNTIRNKIKRLGINVDKWKAI
jgi:two-component system nitrogen regulation response regulator GlnG